MKDRICTSCGYGGKPIRQCYESFLVDLMLWLVVGALALMTGLLPLLLLPLGWTVYHLARFGNSKCPRCENLDMVSLDSRKGREARTRLGDQGGLHAAK